LLVAALVCGGLGLYFEETLVRQSLPVFHAWIGIIDDTYRTVDLHLERRTGEWMIVRLATPAVVHVLGGHVIAADPRSLITGSASAGIVLQPLVLAGALLCAWPARTFREFVLRALLASPLVVLVVLLDVPLMLYGFIWNQEVMALEPERFSLLVTWADFMNAGGRFALTVVAVAASVAMARALTLTLSRRERGRTTRLSPDLPAPPATALPDAPPSPPPGRAA
jgi:hypothetical protein